MARKISFEATGNIYFKKQAEQSHGLCVFLDISLKLTKLWVYVYVMLGH